MRYCQECKFVGTPQEPNKFDCKEKELQHEKTLPTPPTSGQDVLPQDGILQQQQQMPADQEATEIPTAEEEPPASVCQEGQEFNQDLGFCVPT